MFEAGVGGDAITNVGSSALCVLSLQPIFVENDDWHLLKNLREAIDRFLSHTQMPEEASKDAVLANPFRQKRTSGERVRSEGSRKLRLELYQQVNDLYRQGGTILGIARQLHIGHRILATGTKVVCAQKAQDFPARSSSFTYMVPDP